MKALFCYKLLHLVTAPEVVTTFRVTTLLHAVTFTIYCFSNGYRGCNNVTSLPPYSTILFRVSGFLFRTSHPCPFNPAYSLPILTANPGGVTPGKLVCKPVVRFDSAAPHQSLSCSIFCCLKNVAGFCPADQSTHQIHEHD